LCLFPSSVLLTPSRFSAPPPTRAGSARARGIREFSEVDDLGYAGAGYDYSRHMRDIGGGTYVSATGSVLAGGVHATHGAAARLDLPEDVLPSRPEDELERMLEAISLHPASLPRDLRAALDALDEEGEGGDEEEEEAAAGGDDAPAAAAASAGGVAAASAAAAAASSSSEPPGPEGSAGEVPAAAAVAKARAAVAAAGLEELDDEFVLQAAGEGGVGEGICKGVGARQGRG
jgi:hypothetical protein